MAIPFAEAMRRSKAADYDNTLFAARLKELLERRNETMREAALAANLDHEAIFRIMKGRRPNMMSAILLADHFGVNPNEFLRLTGWPTLELFDVQVDRASHADELRLSPDALEVAIAISKITDVNTRQKVVDAILALLQQYFKA
jgi:transcriptional regulator with XRE-family HTH domain